MSIQNDNAVIHDLVLRNNSLEERLRAAEEVITCASHVSANRELGTRKTKRDSWADNDALAVALKAYREKYPIP